VAYGLPGTDLGPSRRITVSVSTGDEIGDFENFAVLAFARQYAETTVDVNGTQAISSTLAPMIIWVGEGDRRVSVFGGSDISGDELLMAARGLEQTPDGPRIRDEAVPEGMQLLDDRPSYDFDLLMTTVRFGKTTGLGGSAYLTLTLFDQVDSDASNDITRPVTDSPGATRWQSASLERIRDDGYVVDWREGDNVRASATAFEMPESELVEFVNGLEVVSEEDWQMFLELASPRGTPTPATSGIGFGNIAVLAAPDDNVSTWLERGHHLGTYLCTTVNKDPDGVAEFVLELPDFQVGSGFDDIEALAEEQRTFPCEP
jgi:hypothetical protein